MEAVVSSGPQSELIDGDLDSVELTLDDDVPPAVTPPPPPASAPAAASSSGASAAAATTVVPRSPSPSPSPSPAIVLTNASVDGGPTRVVAAEHSDQSAKGSGDGDDGGKNDSERDDVSQASTVSTTPSPLGGSTASLADGASSPRSFDVAEAESLLALGDSELERDLIDAEINTFVSTVSEGKMVYFVNVAARRASIGSLDAAAAAGPGGGARASISVVASPFAQRKVRGKYITALDELPLGVPFRTDSDLELERTDTLTVRFLSGVTESTHQIAEPRFAAADELVPSRLATSDTDELPHIAVPDDVLRELDLEMFGETVDVDVPTGDGTMRNRASSAPVSLSASTSSPVVSGSGTATLGRYASVGGSGATRPAAGSDAFATPLQSGSGGRSASTPSQTTQARRSQYITRQHTTSVNKLLGLKQLSKAEKRRSVNVVGKKWNTRRRKNERFDVFFELPNSRQCISLRPSSGVVASPSLPSGGDGDDMVGREVLASSSIGGVRSVLEEWLNGGDTSKYVLKVYGQDVYIEPNTGGGGGSGGSGSDVSGAASDLLGGAEVASDSMSLANLDAVRVAREAHAQLSFEFVPRPSAEELTLSAEVFEAAAKREDEITSSIRRLLGDRVVRAAAHENEELDNFRSDLAKNRLFIRDELYEQSGMDCVPRYLRNEPLPFIIPATIKASVTFPAPRIGVEIAIGTDRTPAQYIEKIFAKYKKQAGGMVQLPGKSADKYILQCTGVSEFVYGDDVRIIDFDCVRRTLITGHELSLWLLPFTPEREPLSLPFVDSVLSTVDPSRPDDVLQPVQRIAEKTLRVKLCTVNNVTASRRITKEDSKHGTVLVEDKERGNYVFFAVVEIYHGIERVCDPRFTNLVILTAPTATKTNKDPSVDSSAAAEAAAAAVAAEESKKKGAAKIDVPDIGTLTFDEWLDFTDLRLSNVSRGMRACFTVYRRLMKDWKKRAGALQSGEVPATSVLADADTPIGWFNTPLCNHSARLLAGERSTPLWLDAAASPLGTCVPNSVGDELTRVAMTIEFPTFTPPAYIAPDAPFDTKNTAPYSRRPRDFKPLDERVCATVDAIVARDPLVPLSADDKSLLWANRHYLRGNRKALPRFVLSVRWWDAEQAVEARRLLQCWELPTAVDALEMLDGRFADPQVRSLAVRILDEGADLEYYDFLLQLTQVLKFEPHHNSILSQFLLRRALQEKSTMGHALFWMLRSQIEQPDVTERYGLILEAFLRGCGDYVRNLIVDQASMIGKMADASAMVRNIDAKVRREALQKHLGELELPKRLHLPLDLRMGVSSLRIDKCKSMDSAKMPLWLVWNNADDDGEPRTVIFKSGDDLRQDALTLQLLASFDKLWKREGLDMHMRVYGCLSTGHMEGMIEVVTESATTAFINKAAGGALKVISKDVLTKWVRANNPSDEEFAAAQQRFKFSCAAYCVATYVLGIGDRHNDNIMMSKKGHLFHIDFGHFLGNFKKFYGLKREKAPFIFTKQYANVLGGSKSALFGEFVELCKRAYNIIRRHSNLIINLFLMMISTGIPELQSVDDVLWLRRSLMLGLSEEAAGAEFAKLIHEAKHTNTTLVNDAVHIWVHS